MSSIRAAPDELGRFAPGLRPCEITLMPIVTRHQFCTQGRPARFHPLTVPR